jgi:lysophospholipase L1-like esterase
MTGPRDRTSIKMRALLRPLFIGWLLLPLSCEAEDPTFPQGDAGASGAIGSGGASGSAGSGGNGTGGSAGSAGSAGAGRGGSPSDGSGGIPSGGSGGTTGGSAGVGGGGAGGSAGAGGAGGGGSGGGASTFSPCPESGPCKILPLGDSITDGVGASGGGGYRIELFSLALAAGKEITFVGGSVNGPQMVDGQPFPRNHEGHSGWTIQQIDDITPAPALDGDPHIILLHIGTNDMYQTPSGAPERLGTLLDQILEAAPDSLLVVAKIIPFPGASGAVGTFNNAIPPLVEARANAGKHIILVDQFTGYPTDQLPDGVHPNATGYEWMANTWYDAISSYLR